MSDLVSVETSDGICRITMNRPAVMNALNRELRRRRTQAHKTGNILPCKSFIIRILRVCSQVRTWINRRFSCRLCAIVILTFPANRTKKNLLRARSGLY